MMNTTRSWIVALCLWLAGCGGVYEVDATEAIAEARVAVRAELQVQQDALEILVDRVADIASRGLQIDAAHLESLYQRLRDDLADVRRQLRELEAEARGEDRASAPATPASGVQ